MSRAREEGWPELVKVRKKSGFAPDHGEEWLGPLGFLRGIEGSAWIWRKDELHRAFPALRRMSRDIDIVPVPRVVIRPLPGTAFSGTGRGDPVSTTDKAQARCPARMRSCPYCRARQRTEQERKDWAVLRATGKIPGLEMEIRP